MKIRVLFSLLVLCSIASAKTYYVATPQNGGNDNYDGLSSAYISGLHGPWASWEKAFTSTSVNPGDTVFIRGGVYYTTVKNGTGIKLTRNGTSDNWIVYINYPGEKPIIDFGNITAEDIVYPGLRNDGISTNGVNYVKLIGLTVRNVKQYFNRNYARGIYLRNGIITIENCIAHNCWGHGIHSEHNTDDGRNTHYIINCDSYNNCDSISGDPLGSNGGATGAGFDAWFGITSGKTYFINCRAWGNSDQGFSLPCEGYVRCIGCWSFANKAYINGTGAGFKMGWQNIDVSFLRREMINCVATFNDGYGFLTNERGSGSTYYAVRSNHYNNIAYHNGYKVTSDGFGFIIQDTQQDNEIERWRNYSNNIDYDNYRKYTYTAEGLAAYSGSNNSWDIPLTLTDADFVSFDTTGITAPRQADGSLPDNNCFRNFLRLSEGSQAINKGIDVGLKYSGTAPDLGPFEYVSGSSIPPDPPVYSGSVIENASPSRLEMTYNLTLANIVPAASAFAVRVNSVDRSISSVNISGTKVLLTLSSPVVHGDVVSVAYTKPDANPIQTPAGGQAASLNAQPVTNNVAVINPVYVSSVIENASPSRLEMTYNLTLANIVPAASAFAVRVNSVDRSISSVNISGTKVLLTLSSPVVYGDVVSVAYTKPNANPIQTPAGGQAASLNAQPVTNNVAVINPVYVSSVIENASPSRLEMTYNLTLANIVPAASAFAVRVNSVDRSISSVNISGTKVLLTLSSPVVYGDVVSMAYTKPDANPIQTPAGGQAASLNAQPVTNNCKKSKNQPPIIRISSPGKSSSFSAPATITFDVYASDPDGKISKIEFYNGNLKLYETDVQPYTFTWKDVPAGTYSITASATDDQNSISVSEPIIITVNNLTTTVNQLPTVSITSPVSNSTFEVPQIISLTAEANDPDGTITKVEYYYGNIKIGESTSPPFMISFEIENADVYEVTAIAYDNLNASGSSSTIILYTVLNSNYHDDIINLYPNPNNGMFTISLAAAPLSEKNIVTISDLTGKILYKGVLNKNENPSQFNLADLNSGIYILMIYNNQIVYTKKFIKT